VIYSDGHVAMKYEEALSKCRFYESVPSSERPKPPYAAVCDVARWTGSICELRGFKGKVVRRHIRLLTQALLERGYTLVYLERPDGQDLDHIAAPVETGDFAGWYRMDLVQLAKKLRIGHGTSTS